MKEQLEKLDSKKIIGAIEPKNRLYLSRLDIFDSISSTNTYLLEQFKLQPERREPGWVCLAEQQTQGRGRLGRQWFSPYARNLYCSLTWSFPAAFSGLAALSLVCGVLLIRMLEHWGIEQGLGLKWPNDILFSGRKLAGILVENLVSTQNNGVVIGLGLNLSLPADHDPAWIAIQEIMGKAPARNQIAGHLLNELLSGLVLFEKQGVQPFLPAMRQYDFLLQKEVQVHTAQGVVSGIAQGLGEEGHLHLLDEEGERQQFNCGEVSVRLKATERFYD